MKTLKALAGVNDRGIFWKQHTYMSAWVLFLHEKSIFWDLFVFYGRVFQVSSGLTVYILFGAQKKIDALQLFMQSMWRSDSYFPKKICSLLHWKLFKKDKKCFFFILKTLLFLTVFKFFTWLFGHVEKAAWLQR